ncbi:Uncharacterised protein [Halioglobus japonicus]|nr:Uncharacterised protein [Halioglobus japonicus]
MIPSFLYDLLALLLCVAGILLLRLSWRRQRTALVWTGWLLLALSPVVWSVSAGVEFAVSYALLALSIAAWLLIAVNVERQPAKAGNGAVDTATLPATTALHKLGTFLVAGPLAASASLLACALLVGLASGAESRGNSMVLTAFVFPLAWGAAVVWVCASDRLLRTAGLLLVVTVVAALGLMP